MALVDLVIGSREFQLACNDGEEIRLKELAREIDRRLRDMGKQQSQGSNDNMLLVMTALMMQDEINELHKNPVKPESQLKNQEENQSLNKAAAKLKSITDFVENLAEKLEKR